MLWNHLKICYKIDTLLNRYQVEHITLPDVSLAADRIDPAFDEIHVCCM